MAERKTGKTCPHKRLTLAFRCARCGLPLPFSQRDNYLLSGAYYINRASRRSCRKLIVFLDLDNTLLEAHHRRGSPLPPERVVTVDEALEALERPLREETGDSFLLRYCEAAERYFFDPEDAGLRGIRRWVTAPECDCVICFRPGVFRWLYELQTLADVYISTTGTQDYAALISRLLDPRKLYILSIFARETADSVGDKTVAQGICGEVMEVTPEMDAQKGGHILYKGANRHIGSDKALYSVAIDDSSTPWAGAACAFLKSMDFLYLNPDYAGRCLRQQFPVPTGLGEEEPDAMYCYGDFPLLSLEGNSQERVLLLRDALGAQLRAFSRLVKEMAEAVCPSDGKESMGAAQYLRERSFAYRIFEGCVFYIPRLGNGECRLDPTGKWVLEVRWPSRVEAGTEAPIDFRVRVILAFGGRVAHEYGEEVSHVLYRSSTARATWEHCKGRLARVPDSLPTAKRLLAYGDLPSSGSEQSHSSPTSSLAVVSQDWLLLSTHLYCRQPEGPYTAEFIQLVSLRGEGEGKDEGGGEK